MNKYPLPPDQAGLETILAEPWLQIGPPQPFPTVEGACFDADGFLIVGHRERPWSDILKIDIRTKQIKVFYHDENASIIGLACHRDGRIFGADISGRLVVISPEGTLERDLLAPFRNKKFMPNDLCFDRRGNLYFSDFAGTPAHPDGAIYRLDMVENYERLHLVAGDLCTPNGVSFSPDFRLLWTAESLKNDVVRIALTEEGWLSPHFSAVLATYHNSGFPHVDSNATDVEGNLYQCIMEGGRALVLNEQGIPVYNILLADRENGDRMRTPNVAISPSGKEGFLLACGTGGAWVYRFASLAPSAPYFAAIGADAMPDGI